MRTWTLELRELRPARAGADVRRAEVPFGPLNAFFYAEVGRPFGWIDRAGWEAGQWQAWAERVELWLVHERGTPGGYAELEAHADHVELAYFGLLEPFRGRGLGGALLTAAVRRALELRPGGPVTVSTNDHDGEHALANYRARGFVVVGERTD